jgi:hypothetical protein
MGGSEEKRRAPSTTELVCETRAFLGRFLR